MALEQRGNNSYYYKKRRIGDRVVSEYCGGGRTAELMSICDQVEAAERHAERARLEQERQEFEMVDKLIEEVLEVGINLLDALHLAHGYHKHKRQWRKIRNGNG